MILKILLLDLIKVEFSFAINLINIGILNYYK